MKCISRYRHRAISLACALFLLSFFLKVDAHALSWHDLWRTPDQQGSKLLAEDKAAQAATQFENENWKAVANYRAEDYQQALEEFAKEDSTQTDYNRGNTLAHLGQYEAAIAAYDTALKKDSNNEDARFNQQIVQQLLDQQQQNPDQNQNQNQDQQNSDQQSPNQSQQNGSGAQDSNQQQQQQQQDNQQADALGLPPAGDDQSQQNPANNQGMPQDQQTQQNFDDQDIDGQAQPTAQQREQQNSSEQLLRQVPDDPGGLLRQKFLRDHLRKQQGERHISKTH